MPESTLTRTIQCLTPLLRKPYPAGMVAQTRLVEDLGADSMFVVEAAVALEDAFGIDELTDAEMARVRTIEDLVLVIDARSQP